MQFYFLLAALWSLTTAAPTQPRSLREDTSVNLTQAIAAHPDAQPHRVSKRGYGVQQDGLDGPCKPITIIFARGTIELGNVGLLAGPPFFDALALKVGADRFAVQGVPYVADIPGYLEGGDKEGSATFAQLTERAAQQCPDTQLVLAGYSQGAQLVHNGAAMIAPETAARVRAVVLFGDPFEGRPMPNISPDIVETFCFETDLICKDTIIVIPTHVAYAIDAVPAAEFVAGKCGA